MLRVSVRSGRLRRAGECRRLAAEMPVFTGGNKRGQDTMYGFLSPLNSPNLPLHSD